MTEGEDLGRILAAVDSIRSSLTSDITEMKKEIRDLDLRLRRQEIDLDGIPDSVMDHDKRIVNLEKFQAQLFVLAALGSILGSGVVALAVRLIAK